MKCMKCVVAVLVMGIATSSQAMQFPEISEQKIASVMSAVSLGVAAYNQLGKFLKDPDAKQLKYQPYIQSFLDSAGMVTDVELQNALSQRDAQLSAMRSALNLLLDDKKEEARAALLSIESPTNRNTPHADSL